MILETETIENILLDDKKIQDVDDCFRILLGYVEYKRLEEVIWKNLKEEDINLVHKELEEIEERIIIEKVLIYAIIYANQEGFNKIINMCKLFNMDIEKKYNNFIKKYGTFISRMKNKIETV